MSSPSDRDFHDQRHLLQDLDLERGPSFEQDRAALAGHESIAVDASTNRDASAAASDFAAAAGGPSAPVDDDHASISLDMDDGLQAPPQSPETVYTFNDTAYGHYRVDLAAQARRVASLLSWRRMSRESMRAERQRPPSFLSKLAAFVQTHVIRTSTMFMLVLGVAVSVVAVVGNLTILGFRLAQFALYAVLMPLPALQIVVWLVWTVGLTLTAAFITSYSPLAVGSGIPQLKAVLSGAWIEDFLSRRTFVAKLCGAVVAAGAGLVVGLEGPYAHVSALLAHALTAVPLFRRMAATAALRDRLVLAACAAGVASNFGAPVGAVLFTIEVTSSYYPVGQYWESFVVAVLSGLLTRIIGNVQQGSAPLEALVPFVSPDARAGVTAFELFFFVVLGAGGGLLGAGFVWAHALLVRFVRWATPIDPRRRTIMRYSMALIVALITAVLRYPRLLGDFMSLSPRVALRDLFDAQPLEADNWANSFANVLVYGALMTAMMLLTMLAPVPAGVLMPVATFGAGFGRSLGNLLQSIVPNGLIPGQGNQPVVAGAFAVVGAASVGAGITQSVSFAVLLCELTGTLTLLPGLLCAVIVAIAVSERLSVSLYDSVLIERGLPFLPAAQPDALEAGVTSLMQRDPVYVPRLATVDEATTALAAVPDRPDYVVPVVDSIDSLVLVGCIHRAALESTMGTAQEFSAARKAALARRRQEQEPVPAAAAAAAGAAAVDSRPGRGPTADRAEATPAAPAPPPPTSVADVAGGSLALQHTSLSRASSGTGLRPQSLRSGDAVLSLPFEPAVQLGDSATFGEAHLLLFALRVPVIFVTRIGRLVGRIDREAAIAHARPPAALRRLTPFAPKT